MTVFFTSDTHFNHKNIIEYCNRPFTSTEEMNETLISNWNSKVSKSDKIYHLGDFSFGRDNTKESAQAIFDRLNGDKHFILGNHDHIVPKGWSSVQNYKEIKVEGYDITLMHYAMRTWNHSHTGSWHLFGHTHGKLVDNGSLSFDVGVDCFKYYPVSFLEVYEIMNQKLIALTADKKYSEPSGNT